MRPLTDYMKMSQKDFWKHVDSFQGEPGPPVGVVAHYWEEAKKRILKQEEASEFLDNLFLYSHQRIRLHSAKLATHYPTKQYTANRLAKRDDLWWTDHFTTGISRWSTLAWFSAEKRKKKSGKMGYAGASTHFVQGYHDLPFYIIPLMHGAWHEPHRNKDSISIEFVNAGKLKHEVDRDGHMGWHYWARALPQSLVEELPPVQLDRPYRGVRIMQPFTLDQIHNAVTLKRIVIAAMPARLDYSRMSQHSDWRDGKTDMGPLWPFRAVNRAAFDSIPIDEYSDLQDSDTYTLRLDSVGTIWDEANGWDRVDESKNPEYGENSETHDDDVDKVADRILTIEEVQKLLCRVEIPTTIDGRMGPKTRKNLKLFQRRWNYTNPNPDDMLKEDGIPGPRTCRALERSV